jgi:hypothetical protein
LSIEADDNFGGQNHVAVTSSEKMAAFRMRFSAEICADSDSENDCMLGEVFLMHNLFLVMMDNTGPICHATTSNTIRKTWTVDSGRLHIIDHHRLMGHA